MSDLIERLHHPWECPNTMSVFALCDEAANEIERQAKRIDALLDKILDLIADKQVSVALIAELEEWKDSCDPGVDKALAYSEVDHD